MFHKFIDLFLRYNEYRVFVMRNMPIETALS